MSDFNLTNHGSIWLLTPVTKAATTWAEEHIPDDAQVLGFSIAIEPRYVDPIVRGIEEEGLSIA